MPPSPGLRGGGAPAWPPRPCLARRGPPARTGSHGRLSSVPRLILHLAVAEARDEMVVHHADGLHERVADGWPHEAEPALDQGLAHGVGFARARGQLAQTAAPVLLGYASHEGPEKPSERSIALRELEKGPCVGHRGRDLLAVADDARVLEQLADFLAVVARHALRVEAIEHLEKARPLVENHAPREAGLKAVEHEFGEQLPIAVQRDTPLLAGVGR